MVDRQYLVLAWIPIGLGLLYILRENEPAKSTTENRINEVKSACVPCAIGHFSTSSRLLNEALRFRKDGLATPQVLDDITEALGEQNALERIDLTPAKIAVLPEWEREMAAQALDKSRELRHRLESVRNMEELEKIAIDTEQYYKHLNRNWLSTRLKCELET